MPGQPVRPELARAWEGYFSQRGGEGPDAPAQALSVIVLDDNSKGPYPPYRSFQGGLVVSPTPAIIGQIGIQNGDAGFTPLVGLVGTTGVPKSVVVIDWLIVARDATAGGDFFVTLTHNNLKPISTANAPVADTAPEKDPTSGATRPQIGNVFVGVRNVDAALIGDQSGQLPGFTQDTLPHRVDGPWMLGPGQILYVERNLVNTGFTAYFRGRYYPAP